MVAKREIFNNDGALQKSESLGEAEKNTLFDLEGSCAKFLKLIFPVALLALDYRLSF